MTTEPQQLMLPLLFAVGGDPMLDRQAIVAEKIRNFELVKEEQA
jgi:hypothetical protein